MRKIKLPTDRIPDGIGEIGEDDRPRRGGVHARTGGVTPPESRRRKPFPHHGVGRIATPGGALSGTSRTDADNPDPPDRGPGPAYPMRVFSTGDKIFHGKAR